MKQEQQAESRCPILAHYRYTWPGKDESFICIVHAPQLQALAEGMGLYLQIIPLTPEELLNDRTCRQKLSSAEIERIQQVEGRNG